MKKLSRIQIFTAVVVLVTTLCSAAFGIYIRNSYTEDIQNLPDNPDTVVMFPTNILPEKNFDLLWDADLIVLARASEMGIFTMESTRVTMDAIHVYKGDLEDGDEFILWQNSRFMYAGLSLDTPTIRPEELSNIILPDKEYIVFAKKKEFGEIYEKYSDKLSLTPEYIPPTRPLMTLEDIQNSTSCYYFLMDETKVGIVTNPYDSDEGNYTPYSEVADCEIICTSVEIADEYNDLKARVLLRLKEDFD